MVDVTDYFLAVYLLAVGEELADLQTQPRETFAFADSPTLGGHMQAYRTDTALVNPKIFAQKIMELRQRLKRLHETAS
ncbi:MAG: hypothetical protein AB7N91_00840 [Candidatus Tectimicrobiota bacterium]